MACTGPLMLLTSSLIYRDHSQAVGVTLSFLRMEIKEVQFQNTSDLQLLRIAFTPGIDW